MNTINEQGEVIQSGAANLPAVREVQFTGVKEIEYAINVIQRRGEEFDNAVQQVQISVLNHIELHGDITLFEKLFNAMPKGSRRNALAEHASKFGKVSVNLDTDAKARKAKPFLYDKAKTTNLVGAEAEPWFLMSPEKPVDMAFDFQAQLVALLKKADKAANDPLKTFAGRDLLEAARKLVGVV